MVKRIIGWFALLVVAAVGFRLTTTADQRARLRWRLVERFATLSAAEQAAIGQRPPEVVAAPGIAGRRCGALRVFVAVPPQIPAGRAAVVPIRIALDNDTYGWLAADALMLEAGQLFSVAVKGPENDAAIWQGDGPKERPSGWRAAERKEFTIDWPIASTGHAPGRYAIELTLGFGARERVVAYTRVE
jgi:hypothetical protein